MSTTSQSDDVQKLAKLIKGIQYAMLTTATADGSLRSRPMATQNTEFDGQLWFFTPLESGKVSEVESDRHVNVSYAEPGSNRYVSVTGRATISRDKAKIHELWTAPMKAWFPNGPDDPNVALLRVDVTEAEYWDAPNNKLVQAIGFVKATLTGTPYHPGEHAKVQMK